MLSAARQPTVLPLPQQGFAELQEREFRIISEFINREVGIQLPKTKHALVQGRLRKRLRVLGFDDFADYLAFALEHEAGKKERVLLIDAITTNKTSFFREAEHFDYLKSEAVPRIETSRKQHQRSELNLWSAGCSSGEEAYTLSIAMHEAARSHPGLRFNILASDISRSCLQTASKGIYNEQQIEMIPMELRKKYILRSRNPDDYRVQMGPEIRSRVRFDVVNLMHDEFPVREKMDVIFCRNVMIYFNKQSMQQLVERFERQLLPGGYFFIGHSESLHGLQTCLKQVAPMVYQKPY